MKLLLKLTSFGVGFGNGAVVPSGRLLLSSEKSPMRVGERESVFKIVKTKVPFSGEAMSLLLLTYLAFLAVKG